LAYTLARILSLISSELLQDPQKSFEELLESTHHIRVWRSSSLGRALELQCMFGQQQTAYDNASILTSSERLLAWAGHWCCRSATDRKSTRLNSSHLGI